MAKLVQELYGSCSISSPYVYREEIAFEICLDWQIYDLRSLHDRGEDALWTSICRINFLACQNRRVSLITVRHQRKY